MQLFLDFTVHFKVSFFNFITNFRSKFDRFSEELIDFRDLLTDIPFLSKEFECIDNKLFADHDDKKISSQACEALTIKRCDQVTNVRIYKLEHVDLVDNRVFVV